MNRVAVPSCKQKGALRNCIEQKAFIDRRGRDKDISSEEWIVSGKFTSCGGREGSVMQIMSLVLTRQFQVHWLTVAFLGEVESTVMLGIKSWFAHMGLSTSGSILGLVFALFSSLGGFYFHSTSELVDLSWFAFCTCPM